MAVGGMEDHAWVRTNLELLVVDLDVRGLDHSGNTKGGFPLFPLLGSELGLLVDEESVRVFSGEFFHRDCSIR